MTALTSNTKYTYPHEVPTHDAFWWRRCRPHETVRLARLSGMTITEVGRKLASIARTLPLEATHAQVTAEFSELYGR